MKSLFLTVSVALLTTPFLPAATLTVLSPGAHLTASPGQTVSWFVRVDNDGDAWMIPNAFQYETLTPVGTFLDVFGPPFNLFVALAPGSSVQFPGIYEIDTAVPPGYLSTGFLVLTYDLFSLGPDDPQFNPDTDLISSGNTLRLAASVRIRDGVEEIPEPGTASLLAAGLAGLAAARLKKRKTR